MSLVAVLVALAAQQPIADRYLDQFLAANEALEANDLPRAKQRFERAHELRPENPTCAYDLACVAARSGDAKSSLDWLARAAQWGYCDASVALWDPDLVSVRSATEFEVVLKAMRSPELFASVQVDGRRSSVVRGFVTNIAFGERGRPPYTRDLATSGDGKTLTLMCPEIRGVSPTIVTTIALDDARRVGEFELAPEGVCASVRGLDGRLSIFSVEDRVLRVRDAIGGAIQSEFELPRASYRATWLSPSPDASRAVLSGSDERARFVELATKSIGAQIGDERDSTRRIVWSTDGALLATGGEHSPIRIWRTADETAWPLQIEAHSAIEDLAFDADAKRLAIGDASGHVRVVELATGRVLADFFHQGILEVASMGCVAFSPDGNSLLTTADGFGGVYLWDLRTHTRRWQDELGTPNHGCSLPAEFSRDGARIYPRSDGAWGVVYDTNTGRKLAELRGFETAQLAPTPNDRFLIGTSPGCVRVFDGQSFALRYSFSVGRRTHAVATSSCYCSGDREALTAASLYQFDQPIALDAFAPLIVDPKRVRAALAGVTVQPARVVAPPKLSAVDSTELHVAASATTIDFDLDVEDELGFSGCEAEIDGRVIDRELSKAFVDVGAAPSAKRVHLAIARNPNAKESSLQISIVSRSGVSSRALHLRVVADE